MKLKDLITPELIEKLTETDQFQDVLLPHHLEGLKDKLMECDEFKGVEDLVIIKNIRHTINGIDTSIKTVLADTIDLQKIVYLYSIWLSPKMFDPSVLHKPVKDNASITPAQYNPFNFEQYKSILLNFNPEKFQDAPNSVRRKLHETLDNILDNPTEYEPESIQRIMLRGLFNVEP